MHLIRTTPCLLAGALAVSAWTAFAAEDYVAPRGPGGVNPDLNGIWQAMNEANYDIERHLARASMGLREGPEGPVPDLATLYLGAVASVPPSLGVVEGGKIPYKPEALATRDENRRSWAHRDPEVKCYLPGVPRATYMPQPFQILQGEKEIEIVYQYAGAVRNIYSEDPGPAPVDSWMGQSVASWDGDTLVLTVTAQDERTWFDRCGQPPQQPDGRGRTVYADRPQPPALRGHDHRSRDLHEALEDQHAAVPAHGAQRHDSRLQVRRVRGGVDLRRVPARTARAVPPAGSLGRSGRV